MHHISYTQTLFIFSIFSRIKKYVILGEAPVIVVVDVFDFR